MKKQIKKCLDKCKPQYNSPKCIENLETCVILSKDRDFLNTQKGDTLEKALDNLENLLGRNDISLEHEGTGQKISSLIGDTLYMSTFKSDTIIINKEEDGTITLETSPDLENIGVGAKIYKAPNKLRTLVSDTLGITEEEGEIRIEFKGGGNCECYSDLIYVRNTYQGREELGTLNKPFKNIENAINFYIGNGTRSIPELYGRRIFVMRGDTYELMEHITASNLNLRLQEGATIRSYASRFIDTGELDTRLSHDIRLHLERDSKILLEGEGIVEWGRAHGDLSINRVFVSGKGTIENNTSPDYILSSFSEASQDDRSFISVKGVTLRSLSCKLVELNSYGKIVLENVYKEAGTMVPNSQGIPITEGTSIYNRKNGFLKEINCKFHHRPAGEVSPFVLSQESKTIIDKCNFKSDSALESFFSREYGVPELKVIFTDIEASHIRRITDGNIRTEVRFNNFPNTSAEEGSTDKGSLNTYGDTAYLHTDSYYNSREAQDPTLPSPLYKGALFIDERSTTTIDKWYLDVIRDI